MRRNGYCIIALLATLVSLGCKIEPNASIRSGTIKDANVEEPLTAMAKKYEPALTLSNQLVDKIAAHAYRDVYQNHCDPLLQSMVDEAGFVSILTALEKQAGPIVRYKRMQWAFGQGIDQGIKTLTSTKIVQHEKELVNYVFVFRHDGRYTKLIGFQYRIQKRAA